VVTQSGTNALHGSLFEFLRNSDLDSRSVFAQTAFVPPFRQNQFGGAVGEMCIRDRREHWRRGPGIIPSHV